MNINPKPTSVRQVACRDVLVAVNDSLWRSVYMAVDNSAVDLAVHLDIDQSVEEEVRRAAYDAVEWLAWWGTRNRPPHPNLDRFVGEISQEWEGAP